MKVLAIGDIHGMNTWEDLIHNNIKYVDKIVFVGDYIDSFTIKAPQQIYNLNKLINFAKKHKNKVELLLGNHDYAVIHGFSSISGYQYMNVHDYKKLFDDNRDLFKIAWGYTDPLNKYTLFTHAGLTRDFWNILILPLFNEGNFLQRLTGKKPDELVIHDTLNYLIDKEDYMWKVGKKRGGSGTASPLWADYSELLYDPFDYINQVYGHTHMSATTMDFIGDNFLINIDAYDDIPGSVILNL